jgi:hypothetical protein
MSDQRNDDEAKFVAKCDAVFDLVEDLTNEDIMSVAICMLEWFGEKTGDDEMYEIAHDLSRAVIELEQSRKQR